MTPNHHAQFVRDDGSTVEVAMLVRCEGYPLPYYVVDHLATVPDTGAPVDLTDAEVERLDDMVGENPPSD